MGISERLHEYNRRRQSVREILREFSTKNEKVLVIPFKNMTEEEVITVILKWMSNKLP